MRTTSKDEEELRKNLLARRERLYAQIAEAKLTQRKPGKIWGTIAILVVLFLLNCWEFYHGRNPWRSLFDGNQWRQWQHPLRDYVVVCIAIPFFLYGLFDYGVGYRKQRKRQKSVADWNRTLDEKVDVNDFKDKDCLYDCLDTYERQRLVHELERMPKGSRSLYKAVLIVSPELIDEAI